MPIEITALTIDANRNTAMSDFCLWLREYNLQEPAVNRVPIVGLDLYSMYEACTHALGFLRRVDLANAEILQEMELVFEMFADDMHG